MCSHLKRRRPLAARTTVFTALITIALVIGTAGFAYADPTTPAEFEAMIDKKWNEIEPVIEEHNGVMIKLEVETKKVEELTLQLKPLQDAVAQTRSKAGVYADYMYRGGIAAGLNAMLTSGDPSIIADRILAIDSVSRNLNTSIDDVLQAKAELDKAKAPIDLMVAQLSILEAEQAARIKVIETEIAKLDELRLKAYADGHGLGELAPVPCPVSYPGGDASTAMKFACAQIGKNYVFATDGPNTYDCSGLTKASWAAAGVSLPHQSAAQRRTVPSVSRSELRPGDLVFYYSPIHHVALYAGKYNGVDWIVHANRAGVPLHMRPMDKGGPIHSYGRPG